MSTGEEDEEPLFDAKSKLYRFDNDSSEWKERGIGQSRVLRHKESGRIRFLFRQEKTLKIRGNHIIMPGTKVQEHGGSDKSVVWSCVDFSDEVQKMELFCLRFASAERAQQFKKAYEDAAAENEQTFAKEEKKTDEEGEGEEEETKEEAEETEAPAPKADEADELAAELKESAKVKEDAE